MYQQQNNRDGQMSSPSTAAYVPGYGAAYGYYPSQIPMPPLLQSLNISIPPGSLGVTIDEINGHCTVISKKNQHSLLEVNDIITSLNGLKLVECDGGGEAWVKLFGAFNSGAKNLVVQRCVNNGATGAAAAAAPQLAQQLPVPSDNVPTSARNNGISEAPVASSMTTHQPIINGPAMVWGQYCYPPGAPSPPASTAALEAAAVAEKKTQIYNNITQAVQRHLSIQQLEQNISKLEQQLGQQKKNNEQQKLQIMQRLESENNEQQKLQIMQRLESLAAGTHYTNGAYPKVLQCAPRSPTPSKNHEEKEHTRNSFITSPSPKTIIDNSNDDRGIMGSPNATSDADALLVLSPKAVTRNGTQISDEWSPLDTIIPAHNAIPTHQQHYHPAAAPPAPVQGHDNVNMAAGQLHDQRRMQQQQPRYYSQYAMNAAAAMGVGTTAPQLPPPINNNNATQHQADDDDATFHNNNNNQCCNQWSSFTFHNNNNNRPTTTLSPPHHECSSTCRAGYSQYAINAAAAMGAVIGCGSTGDPHGSATLSSSETRRVSLEDQEMCRFGGVNCEQTALPPPNNCKYGKPAEIQAFRYEGGGLSAFWTEHYTPAKVKLNAAAKVGQSTMSYYGNGKGKSKCIFSNCEKQHRTPKKVYDGLCAGHFNSLITAESFHHIFSEESMHYVKGLVGDKSVHGLSFHLDLLRLRDNKNLQIGEIDQDTHFNMNDPLYRLDAPRVREVIEEHDLNDGTPVQVFRLSYGNRRIPTPEEATFFQDTLNSNFTNIPEYEEGKHIILLVNYNVTKTGVLVQVLRYLSIFGADIVKGYNYEGGEWVYVDFSYLYSKQIRGMDYGNHFDEKLSTDPISEKCECHDNSTPQEKLCRLHPHGLYFRRAIGSNRSCRDVYNATKNQYLHPRHSTHCLLAMMNGFYKFSEGDNGMLSQKLGFDCRPPRNILISEEDRRRCTLLGKKSGRRLDPFTHDEDALKEILSKMNTFQHTEGCPFHFSLDDTEFLREKMEEFINLLEMREPKKINAVAAYQSAEEILSPTNDSARGPTKKRKRGDGEGPTI